MASEWRQFITDERKMQPSHRRHVFRYDDYIVKVALEADEPDYMGNFHDPRRTALADENVLRAIDLVQKNTTIPVPEIVDSGPGFTVFKRIDGVDLESAWSRLS